MRKAILGSLGAVVVLAWGSPSAAQVMARSDFGDRGTVTLSVERVFGLHWVHSEWDATDPAVAEDDSSMTVFGLGWYRSETAYHNPRVAADVFVIDQLSVGGSLGLYTWGGDGDRFGILFQPRVGYALMFNDWVGFWPRGGLTFFSEEASGGGPTYSQFALSGEGMFLFFPADQWAILAGPTVDLGIVGEVGNTDFTQHSLGVTAGLMGIF